MNSHAAAIALAALSQIRGLQQITAEINESGELLITMPTGEVINAGVVVGADGRDGVDGQDGRDGKPGKPGKDGKTGLQGPRGLDGKPGKDGKDGRDGQDGMLGRDGKDGKDGNTGPQGERGPVGAKGKDGRDGPPGAVGKSPQHRWKGTALQFKQPDGKWGKATDLRGPSGPSSGNGNGGTAVALFKYVKPLVGYTVVIQPAEHNVPNVVDVVVKDSTGKRVGLSPRVVGGVVTLESNINLAGCTAIIFGD